MFGSETPDLQGLTLKILLNQLRAVVVNPTGARASIYSLNIDFCLAIEQAEKLLVHNVHIHGHLRNLENSKEFQKDTDSTKSKI